MRAVVPTNFGHRIHFEKAPYNQSRRVTRWAGAQLAMVKGKIKVRGDIMSVMALTKLL